MARYELEYPIAHSVQSHSSCGFSRKTEPGDDARLNWWREARFGMFVHWGLYAITAGIWRGKRYRFISEWIMQQAKISIAEYEQLAAQFDPKQHDPESWVQLALDAGAKYLVITAKHHDGFALFDSPSSEWNVVERTPYGKDLIAPLAEACRRRGLKLGFYYSQDLDWHHPHGSGNDWDFPNESAKDAERYLAEKVKPQLQELLTNYGPVGLLWFDTPVRIDEQQSRDLASFVHSLQPACLVSGRIGHNAGDFGSLEDNSIPNGPIQGDWEMPATINETWGYKAFDENWKSPSELIRQLADLASKGVNYLLNIGPDAEGRIPEESANRMRVIGRWLQKHGEAIYETRANPFPYAFPWGSITQRSGKLYLLFEKWPQHPLQLHGLRNRVQKAYLLNSPDETIDHERTEIDGLGIPSLTLKLPSLPPDPHVSCIVLDIEGNAEVDWMPVPDETGRLVLPSQLAVLNNVDDNAADNVAARIGFSGLIEQWKDTETTAHWDFQLTEPGEYDVWVVSGTVSAHADWYDSHRISIDVAGQHLSGKLSPDRDSESRRSYYFPEKASRMGRVSFSERGKYSLIIKAEQLDPEAPDGLCVAEIRLEPVA